jgi:predicted aldo/keto reductase-like oxidoreductase
MDELKKQGKVKHLGVSCHGSAWAYDTKENLEKIMLSAVEDGRFDVLLLSYNFVNAEMGEKVLEACDKKNIATMIMKSNPVHIYGLMEQRVNGLKEKGEEIDEYTQAFYDKYKVMNDSAQNFFQDYNLSGEQEVMKAASRFVLSNTMAHTTIWDFKNLEDVDMMLGLSGTKLTKQEKLVLNGYHNYLGKYNCRIGCNECESACPHNLPVNKILRYNYYFGVKKQEKRAIQKFAKLNIKKPSEVCSNCEAHCEDACKYGVLTRSLLAMAEQNMTNLI